MYWTVSLRKIYTITIIPKKGFQMLSRKQGKV